MAFLSGRREARLAPRGVSRLALVFGAYGLRWYGSVEEAAAMTDLVERFEPDPRAAALYNTLFEEAYKPCSRRPGPSLAAAQVRVELAPMAETMRRDGAARPGHMYC